MVRIVLALLALCLFVGLLLEVAYTRTEYYFWHRAITKGLGWLGILTPETLQVRDWILCWWPPRPPWR